MAKTEIGMLEYFKNPNAKGLIDSIVEDDDYQKES